MNPLAESYDMISIETIAKIAGVDGATAEGWADGDESFPRPLVRLSEGPLWDRKAVEKWLLEHGLRGVEPPPAP